MHVHTYVSNTHPVHIHNHWSTPYLLQVLLDHVGDTVVGGKEQGQVLRLLNGEGIHGTSTEDAFSSVAMVRHTRMDDMCVHAVCTI